LKFCRYFPNLFSFLKTVCDITTLCVCVCVRACVRAVVFWIIS
jgi:hypothetical protein